MVQLSHNRTRRHQKEEDVSGDVFLEAEQTWAPARSWQRPPRQDLHNRLVFTPQEHRQVGGWPAF
jgi:hypothetical protein